MSQLLDLTIKSRIEASGKRRVVQDRDLCCTSAPQSSTTVFSTTLDQNPSSLARSPLVRKFAPIPS